MCQYDDLGICLGVVVLKLSNCLNFIRSSTAGMNAPFKREQYQACLNTVERRCFNEVKRACEFSEAKPVATNTLC